MIDLEVKELSIIKAIHQNHKKQLENQMTTQFTGYLKQTEHPEKIYSWLEKIADTRLLVNSYLDTIALSRAPSSVAALEKEATGINYYLDKATLLFPQPIRDFFFNSKGMDENSLFNGVTAELFSLALGKGISDVLFDYFNHEFLGAPENVQKEFNENLEKHTELSNLIKKECERISIEIIKLFHFREMLFMGRTSQSSLEPDAKDDFIKRAELQNEQREYIHLSIELYFVSELNRIFNSGFNSLYQVHEVEIQSEQNSPIIKWLNQISESEQTRLAFTQEIQLKFMMLARDYLVEKMNQKGLLANYPALFSLLAGITLAPIVGVTLMIVLGGSMIWAALAFSVLVFALTSILSHVLITRLSALTYKRSSDNRQHIQESIDMINNEYIRLKKESSFVKETTLEDIESTKDFQEINQQFIQVIHGSSVALGSISGWLREYASRYRHSKAISVDLEHEYKKIIAQSKVQTQTLIKAINSNKHKLVHKWVQGTMEYLKEESHQTVIKEFELRQKIKEQVLEIISQVKYIPQELLEFYNSPEDKGGLAGNESDFAHIRRLAPDYLSPSKKTNPYEHLCNTALRLFKVHEPAYSEDNRFFGDPDYRQMLGIARRDYNEPITTKNIELLLNNSYAFLVSLCIKIKPGLGLNPLIQTAQVSDEFLLYRTLLLKELTSLSDKKNKTIRNEVKLQIRAFIKKHFNQDPQILCNNIANQAFLLNKEVQSSQTYSNQEQFTVTDIELDNIFEALTLDMAYNSQRFILNDILTHYMDSFFQQSNRRSREVFAYSKTEQELNPQGTTHFAKTITNYCENTADFLATAESNKALTMSHIFMCYQFNVSVQVYQTQLRIISSIKDINKLAINSNTNDQIKCLLGAFQELSRFAANHCFPMSPNAPCFRLIKLVEQQANQELLARKWIKYIDAKEILGHMIEHLAETIEMNFKPTYTPAFFKQNTLNGFKKEEHSIHSSLVQ
ncbi:hypothetical protein [Legionella waltersii]|uniref:Uncharacterized protein n=1 Tax=Legionella waltersii TaxID=66969 RepID=A0A0W1A2R4_9GAMM|nr:hypothetical protein [Legionella waltersii]KTD75627.1 hypothetical protein Lwal_2565 [Legionella waltersii]SNU98989.1 Uncharacterised protein [Legionella waltersii]